MIVIKRLLLILLFAFPTLVNAGSVARDSETENAFKEFNRDIEKKMGYKDGEIKYRLIISDDFNAMVAGGKNIFYNSGFILQVKNLRQFIAVSAHEMAHIKNGDLIKLTVAHKKATNRMAVGMGLSALAGLASGSADTTIGLSLFSAEIAEKGFVGFVRGQEKSADALALKTFKDLKYSPLGIVEVQKMMYAKEGFVSKNQSYNRTHPTSKDRLEEAETAYKDSKYKDNKFPKKLRDKFLRIQAKLFGYTKKRQEVLNKYPVGDNSDNARYARGMHYYANSQAKLAIKEIKKLVEKYPNDIYYQESYAMLLSILGEHNKAIAIYKKLLKKHRKAELFWIDYGRILTKAGGKQNFKEAEYALLRAKFLNPEESYLYYVMTSLYSKTKQEGKRLLARAETMLLQGSPKAKDLAEQALAKLKKGTADYIRAEDIIALSSGE